ncbi:tetratricopeptide repeat protein [Microbispora sp. NPDC046933]|uniref:tetratricopeptide repeat protein n=1 Tax=Microbispora sp. NPDC046933 TaxID=3155618 RepID=UPI0033EEF811
MWQRILSATPADHPQRALCLSSLGIVLLTRFERTGAMADLDEAIQRGRQAVQLTPADHPNRIGILNNLRNALQSRPDRT